MQQSFLVKAGQWHAVHLRVFMFCQKCSRNSVGEWLTLSLLTTAIQPALGYFHSTGSTSQCHQYYLHGSRT